LRKLSNRRQGHYHVEIAKRASADIHKVFASGIETRMLTPGYTGRGMIKWLITTLWKFLISEAADAEAVLNAAGTAIYLCVEVI